MSKHPAFDYICDHRDALANENRILKQQRDELMAAIAASCDEDRSQLYESGIGGGCARAISAEQQRDELLDAIETVQTLIHSGMDDVIDRIYKCVSGAIAKAGEKQ